MVGGAGKGTRTPRPSSAGRCCGIGGGASPAGGTTARRPASPPPSTPRRRRSSKRPSTPPLHRPKSEAAPSFFQSIAKHSKLPLQLCTYMLCVTRVCDILIHFCLACTGMQNKWIVCVCTTETWPSPWVSEQTENTTVAITVQFVRQPSAVSTTNTTKIYGHMLQFPCVAKLSDARGKTNCTQSFFFQVDAHFKMSNRFRM